MSINVFVFSEKNNKRDVKPVRYQRKNIFIEIESKNITESTIIIKKDPDINIAPL
jgi:hypothetical protein